MLCGRLRLEGIRCYHRMTDIAAGAWGAGAGRLLVGLTEVIVDAAKLKRARELLRADD